MESLLAKLNSENFLKYLILALNSTETQEEYQITKDLE